MNRLNEHLPKKIGPISSLREEYYNWLLKKGYTKDFADKDDIRIFGKRKHLIVISDKDFGK